ncbi:MAG: HAD family acid phosphatase [Corynebacterium sp.]|nr:HAD family acid phosphatase [Corynebacterium sp.]
MSNLPQAAIFDMDGTLCDVRTIRHIVTSNPKHRNFHKFHNASIDCPAYPQVVNLYRALQAQGIAMIVVTARTEHFSFLTNLWLRDHGLACDELLMRANKDQRPDHAVKQDLLQKILRQYRPIVAVDDRPQIAEVWRSNGIPTIMVSESGDVDLSDAASAGVWLSTPDAKTP